MEIAALAPEETPIPACPRAPHPPLSPQSTREDHESNARHVMMCAPCLVEAASGTAGAAVRNHAVRRTTSGLSVYTRRLDICVRENRRRLGRAGLVWAGASESRSSRVGGGFPLGAPPSTSTSGAPSGGGTAGRQRLGKQKNRTHPKNQQHRRGLRDKAKPFFEEEHGAGAGAARGRGNGEAAVEANVHQRHAAVTGGGSPQLPRHVRQQQPGEATGARGANTRRFFLASLGGAVLAETAGQLVERSLISESARLRLQQRRAIETRAVASFAETEETVTEEIIVFEETGVRELQRAGAISALAAVGAIGSKVISRIRQPHTIAEAPSFRPLPVAAPTLPTGLPTGADGGAVSACLTGGSCSPEWNSAGGADAIAGCTLAEGVSFVSDAPADAAGVEVVTAATSPWWTRGDFVESVAKTVVFSACYGGFFQPHWFNVLNSYAWSDIIHNAELNLQLRTLGEQLQQGQSMPGAPAAAAGASLAFRHLFEYAGGYTDPSLVAAVSLSLAAPLEAASNVLAPLAVNQLVAIPLLYWPSFFIFSGAVEGKSVGVVLQTLYQRLPALK